MASRLSLASPQRPRQHPDLGLDDGHRVEDQVLAESAAQDLHARGKPVDEPHRDQSIADINGVQRRSGRR